MIRALRPLCLLLLPLLTGCFTTHLAPDEPRAELDNLAESAPENLSLVLHNPLRDVSHGYQFMLFILPISRVFAEDVSQVVAARLQLHAGVAGIGLSQQSLRAKPSRQLEITISSLDINGYDLLVFRRPSAQVTLTGTLHSSEGPPQICTQTGKYSEVTRFAFSPELNRALALAADEAAKKLLTCLGITDHDSGELILSDNL